MAGNDQFQLILGREDVSAFAESISFSSTDPGGFEAASIDFPRNLRIPRGTPLRILYGQGVAWEGRVNEVNRSLSGNPNTQLACQGYGAIFKENGEAQIFVDRDVSHWGDTPLNRKVGLAAAAVSIGDFSFVAQDGALVCALPNSALGAQTIAEAWYIAPSTVTITKLAYIANATAKGLAYESPVGLFTATDDSGTGIATNKQNLTQDNTLRSAIPLAASRYAILRVYSNGVAGTPAAGANDRYTALAIYGNHGLTTRAIDSSNPDGVYTSDVASYAVTKMRRLGYNIQLGIIEEVGYVVPHWVYPTAVMYEQMIEDAANLAGFHYGVWEGRGLDLTPRFDFRSYPSAANGWINKRDADDLILNDSLDGLFNTAVVTYRAPGTNTQEPVTCTRNIAALNENGITRTLYIDMGMGTAASATAFGNIVLAIAELNASTTGSFKSQGTILTKGGDKPVWMLRPGLDRLKITDLLTGDDGQTEMIVKRVATEIGSSGPSSTVDLGQGADFLTTLQARLNVALVPLGLG